MLLPTDKSVEVAISGEADMIVTEDMDLQVLNPVRGIRIITRAKYIGCWRGRSRCRLDEILQTEDDNSAGRADPDGVIHARTMATSY